MIGFRPASSRFPVTCWVLVVAVAFGAVPITLPIAAAAEAPRNVVRFQADRDNPPFSSDTPRVGAEGYDVELIRDAAARAGLNVDVQLDDWQVVRQRFDRGTVDVVPMLVTPERAQKYLFTHSYLQRYYLVFGRRGHTFIGSLEGLKGQRVAVQREGRALEAIRVIDGVVVVPVTTQGEALGAVAQARADVALVPAYTGFEAMRRLRERNIVPLSLPLLNTDYAFAVSNNRADLKRRLDAGLEQSIQSGEANRIYVRWLGNLTPKRETYRSGMLVALWLIIPMLALLAFLLARWRKSRAAAHAAEHAQRDAEQTAMRLRYHDPVTNLPNAVALSEHLVRLVGIGDPFALVRIELSDLHRVEAITGYVFVDRLLLALASRLRDHGDLLFVATAGRSTFYAVCPGGHGGKFPDRIMADLAERLSMPVEIDGMPLEVACTAGAAAFPLHGREAEVLMRAASIACAAAADAHDARMVYDRRLDPDPRNLTLLADLRRAIAESTLGFALQAKVGCRTGAILGAEMLVRWEHPKYGMLSPDQFVPLAERTQVIGEMTLYLIDRALDLSTAWAADGLALELAVNISANDLLDPRVMSGLLERAQRGSLVLEITETAVMRDPERALAAARLLRAHGIKISLDDFGTGNASLTFLRQLHPDEVKIDRSFVTDVRESAADQAIVRSIIGLAHSLGATVTAEGVEDAQTMDWLRSAGADSAQGYGLARPEAAAMFYQRVARGNHEQSQSEISYRDDP